jgi:hypothetical protein
MSVSFTCKALSRGKGSKFEANQTFVFQVMDGFSGTKIGQKLKKKPKQEEERKKPTCEFSYTPFLRRDGRVVYRV